MDEKKNFFAFFEAVGGPSTARLLIVINRSVFSLSVLMKGPLRERALHFEGSTSCD